MIKTLFESDMFVGLLLTIGGGLLLLYAIKTRNKYKLFTYGFDWTIDKFRIIHFAYYYRNWVYMFVLWLDMNASMK